MKKEFNLSEKGKVINIWTPEMRLPRIVYTGTDVKEFIRRILEEELEGKDLFIKIRELAGEKLT